MVLIVKKQNLASQGAKTIIDLTLVSTEGSDDSLETVGSDSSFTFSGYNEEVTEEVIVFDTKKMEQRSQNSFGGMRPSSLTKRN